MKDSKYCWVGGWGGSGGQESVEVLSRRSKKT